MVVAQMCHDSNGCVAWEISNLPASAKVGDVVTAMASSWHEDERLRTFKLTKLFRSRIVGHAAYGVPQDGPKWLR